VAITQLGGNTFMATNTNTVVLFLRKRNETEVQRIKEATYNLAESYPKTNEDLTINGIEKPVKKYLEYTEETEINPEKFFYFVLNYKQKTVIIKTGEKDAEKRFLGYKISHTRGKEGFHSIESNKTIDECTKLFDEKTLENPQKASTYIYNAFNNNNFHKIDKTLKDNVFCADLIDMLTFDRDSFDKNISLVVKKKVKIESRWEEVKLAKTAEIVRGITYSKNDQTLDRTNNIVLTADNITLDGHFDIKKEVFLNKNFNVSNEKLLKKNDIFMCFSSGSKEHLGKVAFIENNTKYIAGGFMAIIRVKENILPKYLFQLLNSILRQSIRDLGTGSNINNLSSIINDVKIPLPPLEIQQKIVSEIEILEKNEAEAKGKIEKGKEQIGKYFSELDNNANKILRLSNNDIFEVSIGKRVLSDEVNADGKIPVYSANVFEPFGFIDKYLISDFSIPSVLWGIDGDWMVNFMPVDKPFYPTDHCGVLRVKKAEVLPKYLVWLLNNEGKKIGFSRTLRASIDRIEGITIKVPPLSAQQKIVSEIEKIETQIAVLEQEVAEIPKQKEEILKKNI
jgi:type I restriction enzyme M protein